MKKENFKEQNFEEVNMHNKHDDLWLVINNIVQDVTKMMKENSHPGGNKPLEAQAGCDATEAFQVQHPNIVQLSLGQYKIGKLKTEMMTEARINAIKKSCFKDACLSEATVGYLEKIDTLCKDEKNMMQEFHAIRHAIEKENLYQGIQWWQTKQCLTIACCQIISMYLIFQGNQMSLLMGSIALGMCWQQTALIGHDAGHNNIAGTKAGDLPLGLAVTTLFGVSGAWWKDNHNTHHIITNSVERDPDIQHLPLFAVTPKIFSGYQSTYYKVSKTLDAAAKVILQVQHKAFIPVMCFARFNMQAQSFIFLLNVCRNRKEKQLDLTSLLGFWTWQIFVLRMVQLQQGLAWMMTLLLLSNATVGILHIQICISHFAMQTFDHAELTQLRLRYPHASWLMLQLLTSIDIRSNWLTDFFHGGLQLQAVHHMFPSVPRNKLRQVRDKQVVPFTEKYQLPQQETTFINGIKLTLAKMKKVSESLQNHIDGLRVDTDDIEFLKDFLNMIG